MGMLSTLIGTRVPEKYRKYFDLPKREPSWSITATDDTALGRACRLWLEQHPHLCGVYRLDVGLDALAVRLGLIERAERSIDIQSYLIRDDLSGNLIVMRLIEAADRGVRVRLLMDDALTEPIDSGLVAISNHPNIEVRVFNPFPRRRNRIVSYIAYFNILNRRMHNKTFTVDNQVTIVGGRNIADEYFETSGSQEFIDEDLLLIGNVVSAVSAGFDEYWNYREALPINIFDPFVEYLPIRKAASEGRRYLHENLDNAFLGHGTDQLADALLSGSLPWIAARAEVICDRPDKVRRIVRRRQSEATAHLQKMVSSASYEAIIVSPYFVPQKQGIDFFARMVKRGTRVIVITNSLASTNHTSVHAVYERYRKPLLRQGIELYELRANVDTGQLDKQAGANAKLTLHSKVAVVDRTRLFVGSFNLDPRSLYLNTEMGVDVDSPELAATMARDIVESLPRTAYKLRLRRSGALQWIFTDDGVEVRANSEPDTTFGRRFKVRLMGYLPIEGQM